MANKKKAVKKSAPVKKELKKEVVAKGNDELKKEVDPSLEKSVLSGEEKIEKPKVEKVVKEGDPGFSKRVTRFEPIMGTEPINSSGEEKGKFDDEVEFIDPDDVFEAMQKVDHELDKSAMDHLEEDSDAQKEALKEAAGIANRFGTTPFVLIGFSKNDSMEALFLVHAMDISKKGVMLKFTEKIGNSISISTKWMPGFKLVEDTEGTFKLR